MNNKDLYFLLITSLILFTCSKDKDDVKPIITVNYPVSQQQVNGIDTVLVSASISDDRNIKLVQVSLRNRDNIPVLSTIIRKPDSSFYDLNVLYFFDDMHLTSGQYDLVISAFDGENTTTSYVTLYLNEEPKIRKGLFIVSNSGTGSEISYLDNNYNASLYKSISGDFIGAAISSLDQQLIHASSITGSLSSRDLNSGNQLWDIPILTSPPIPFYTGFLYDNNTVYVGNRNGGIRGYDKNGASNYSALANNGYYMENAFVHKDIYLVSEQQQISGNFVQLVLYWKASGDKAQELSINEDIQGIYAQSDQTIILLTNDVFSKGKMIIYDIITGLASSPFSINVEKISACTEISAGLYIIAEHDNLTLINANNFSKLPYLKGIIASKLWYDVLTNELFVVSGNTLNIYDYSSKVLKGSYQHHDNIKELCFWYNK